MKRQGHARTCPRRGYLNRGEVPPRIRAHVIGPRLAAVMSYFSGRRHLSRRAVEEVVETVFQVPISLGGAHRSRLPSPQLLGQPGLNGYVSSPASCRGSTRIGSLGFSARRGCRALIESSRYVGAAHEGCGKIAKIAHTASLQSSLSSCDGRKQSTSEINDRVNGWIIRRRMTRNRARPREAAKARPREAAQRKSRFTLEPRITPITLIIA